MSEGRKRIILVDDVSFHLMSTKERLKKHYEIFTAQSAEIMFEILESAKPDLILLDISMPEADGYETIKKLKADPAFAAIPVIFLTAKNDKESIVKGMSLGAVDFVKKPFADSKLIECIENHLNPGKNKSEKPVILAVDDSPSMLESINHVLKDQYTVYKLSRPEVLEGLLAKLTPDLFLLDYQMPVLTGFDLIPIIRRYPAHEETPIVFLTSEGTLDHLTAAINLGACDFIIKPIDEVILREKMARHLTDYIMRRRIRTLNDK